MSEKKVNFKIKKGDFVIVIAGSSRRETGKIFRVDRKSFRVWVEGVNMSVLHKKPSAQSGEGGRVHRESSIHVSNVAFFDAGSQRASRVGMRFDSGKKIRYSKRSGRDIGVVSSEGSVGKSDVPGFPVNELKNSEGEVNV